MSNQRQLLFCLDYDNTYTEDPILWNEFIELLKQRGHRIILATMRYEIEGKEVELALARKVEKIIYTDRHAKKPYLAKLGIEPDIWIDDTPEFLVNDSAEISLQ